MLKFWHMYYGRQKKGMREVKLLFIETFWLGKLKSYFHGFVANLQFQWPSVSHRNRIGTRNLFPHFEIAMSGGAFLHGIQTDSWYTFYVSIIQDCQVWHSQVTCQRDNVTCKSLCHQSWIIIILSLCLDILVIVQWILLECLFAYFFSSFSGESYLFVSF